MGGRQVPCRSPWRSRATQGDLPPRSEAPDRRRGRGRRRPAGGLERARGRVRGAAAGLAAAVGGDLDRRPGAVRIPGLGRHIGSPRVDRDVDGDRRERDRDDQRDRARDRRRRRRRRGGRQGARLRGGGGDRMLDGAAAPGRRPPAGRRRSRGRRPCDHALCGGDVRRRRDLERDRAGGRAADRSAPHLGGRRELRGGAEDPRRAVVPRDRRLERCCASALDARRRTRHTRFRTGDQVPTACPGARDRADGGLVGADRRPAARLRLSQFAGDPASAVDPGVRQRPGLADLGRGHVPGRGAPQAPGRGAGRSSSGSSAPTS